MSETRFFKILPQHKRMIIDLLKSLYKISISEDEIDNIQKEEPFVDFNYRQAEFLRRTIVLRKICHPILKRYKHAEKASQERFQFSFVNQYLNEAQGCFVHDIYLASIMLCRSSLEIALREAIAHVESCKNKNNLSQGNILSLKKMHTLLEKYS